MNASRQKRLRLTWFSLRGGLFAVTVFAVWFGLHMQSVKRQRAALEAPGFLSVQNRADRQNSAGEVPRTRR